MIEYWKIKREWHCQKTSQLKSANFELAFWNWFIWPIRVKGQRSNFLLRTLHAMTSDVQKKFWACPPQNKENPGTPSSMESTRFNKMLLHSNWIPVAFLFVRILMDWACWMVAGMMLEHSSDPLVILQEPYRTLLNNALLGLTQKKWVAPFSIVPKITASFFLHHSRVLSFHTQHKQIVLSKIMFSFSLRPLPKANFFKWEKVGSILAKQSMGI